MDGTAGSLVQAYKPLVWFGVACAIVFATFAFVGMPTPSHEGVAPGETATTEWRLRPIGHMAIPASLCLLYAMAGLLGTRSIGLAATAGLVVYGTVFFFSTFTLAFPVALAGWLLTSRMATVGRSDLR